MNENVTELYAWTAKDPDGIEGIVQVPHGDPPSPLALVTSDRSQALRLASVAAISARLRGQTATLKLFTLQEVVQTIVPPEAN